MVSTRFSPGKPVLEVGAHATPLIRVNPGKPIYFRPFKGVIYNSICNDRLGAHLVIQRMETHNTMATRCGPRD